MIPAILFEILETALVYYRVPRVVITTAKTAKRVYDKVDELSDIAEGINMVIGVADRNSKGKPNLSAVPKTNRLGGIITRDFFFAANIAVFDGFPDDKILPTYESFHANAIPGIDLDQYNDHFVNAVIDNLSLTDVDALATKALDQYYLFLSEISSDTGLRNRYLEVIDEINLLPEYRVPSNEITGVFLNVAEQFQRLFSEKSDIYLKDMSDEGYSDKKGVLASAYIPFMLLTTSSSLQLYYSTPSLSNNYIEVKPYRFPASSVHRRVRRPFPRLIVWGIADRSAVPSGSLITSQIPVGPRDYSGFHDDLYADGMTTYHSSLEPEPEASLNDRPR